MTLPAGDAQPELLVYSDPEQEITGLMENLVMEAGRCAPHEIAVVLCDSKSYSPAISKQAPGYTRRTTPRKSGSL